MTDELPVTMQLGIRLGLAVVAGLVGMLAYEQYPPFAAAGFTFSGRFSLGVPLLLVFLVTGVWSVARMQGEPHRLRHAWGLLAVHLVTYGAVWHRVRELNLALLSLGPFAKSSKIGFGGLSALIVWGSVASAGACAIVTLLNGVIMMRRRRTRR